MSLWLNIIVTMARHVLGYLNGPLRNDDVILLRIPHGELLPDFIDALHPGTVLPLWDWVLL